MKSPSTSVFKRLFIILAASTMVFWACHLTQNGTPEDKVSFTKLYDSLSKFDSVVIVFKDRDGALLDTVFQGPIKKHSDIENLSVKKWDGGQAIIEISGFKGGLQVYKTEKNFNGKTDSTEGSVMVIDPEATLSSLDREIQLVEGLSLKYPAITVQPSTHSNKAIKWSTPNPEIISVGTDSLKALKPGSAKLIAALELDPSKTLNIQVTVLVNTKIPESLLLSPDTLLLATGGASSHFTVSVNPTSASNKVIWHSLDPLVAGIADDGSILGLKKGKVQIWAESKEKSNVFDSAWVDVSDPVPVEQIRFLKDSTNLFLGGAFESLMVEVLPLRANSAVLFTVTDPSILSLKDNRILGLIEGVTTVLVKSKENPAKSASLKVKVLPNQHVDSLTLLPKTLKLFTGGETGTLFAKVYPLNLSQEIQWVSSNPATATVDNSGKVSPVSPGTVYILARSLADSVQKDSAVVTVKRDAPLLNAGGDTTISLGKTVIFLPVVAPQEYGIITQFKWDLDGNSTWDDSAITVKSVSFKYDVEKEYSVRFYVRDSEGNETNVIKKVKAVKGPVVLILFPLNNSFSTKSTISVSWSINDVKQDSLNSEVLKEGANTIIRSTKDVTGKPVETSVVVYLDILAPNKPIVHGSTFSATTTPTRSWASGGSGGNGIYRVAVDSEYFVSSPPITDTTWTMATALTENIHTIFVQERDAAGNWSASGKLAFRVDVTPPVAPILKVNTPPFTNIVTPVWSWTGAVDGAGVFQYKVDNGTFPSGAIDTKELSYVSVTGMAPGIHTFYVREMDSTGNWSPVTSSQITIDLTPPLAPKVTGTTPTSLSPKWIWTPGGGGSGDYRFHLGSDPTVTDPETKLLEYALTTSTSGSAYTLYIQERDQAGNWSPSGSLPITFDLSKPTVSISVPINSGTYTTKLATIAVSGNAGPKNITKVTFAYTVAGGTNGAGSAILAADGSWTINSVPLTEGKPTSITVTATDAIGNTVDAVITAVRDNTPPLAPIFVLPTTASPTRNRNPTWKWQSGGGGGNGTFSFQLGVNTAVIGSATSFVGSVLADGSYTMTVMESDSATNWSAGATSTIIIKGDAPRLPTLSVNATLTNVPKWSWAGSGGGNGIFRYKLDAAAYPASGSVTTTIAPSDLSDGSHSLCVQEADLIDWGTEACASITVDKTAPVVTIVAPVDGFITNSSTVTVICSVDGVEQAPFAKTLLEGSNKISCSSTDVAGNLGNATPRTTYRQSNVLFVKKGFLGGDGSSWQKPYGELANALLDSKASTPGTQIWVSSGVYTAPTGGFIVKDGIGLYGGFATLGTPNSLTQRDSTTAALSVLTAASATDKVMSIVHATLEPPVRNVTVNAFQFESPGQIGLYASNVEDLQVSNCYFKGFTGNALFFRGLGSIIKCNFHHNQPENSVIYLSPFSSQPLSSLYSILISGCTIEMNYFTNSMPVFGTGDGKVLFKDTNFLDVVSAQINTDLGLETFRGCTVTGGKSTIINYGDIDYDATNSPPP